VVPSRPITKRSLKRYTNPSRPIVARAVLPGIRKPAVSQTDCGVGLEAPNRHRQAQRRHHRHAEQVLRIIRADAAAGTEPHFTEVDGVLHFRIEAPAKAVVARGQDENGREVDAPAGAALRGRSGVRRQEEGKSCDRGSEILHGVLLFQREALASCGLLQRRSGSQATVRTDRFAERRQVVRDGAEPAVPGPVAADHDQAGADLGRDVVELGPWPAAAEDRGEVDAALPMPGDEVGQRRPKLREAPVVEVAVGRFVDVDHGDPRGDGQREPDGLLESVLRAGAEVGAGDELPKGLHGRHHAEGAIQQPLDLRWNLARRRPSPPLGVGAPFRAKSFGRWFFFRRFGWRPTRGGSGSSRSCWSCAGSPSRSCANLRRAFRRSWSTHEELLAQVWRGAVVSDSAVRGHLHELRQVLGDDVIETVTGRGYRFVAELDDHVEARAAPQAALVDPLVVGRDAELETLRAAFEHTRGGNRQLCFVIGEPGIGKSTLMRTFLAGLDPRKVIVARGSCFEQHGTPEPYLAIIEAFTALARSPRGAQTLAALRPPRANFRLAGAAAHPRRAARRGRAARGRRQ